jgi:hypothetical protein
MTKTFRTGSYFFIFIAVIWSLVAIGNGKVANFFGAEIFVAAKEDMMVALALNAMAAVCFIILGIIALRNR